MNVTAHDSETPANGQQVITACAFIHTAFAGINKVFLAKRADSKKFLPAVYELPGGHIEFGEDIVKGLQREISEEFGMSLRVGDPVAVFTYMNHVKGSHSIEVVYFARFNEPTEQITLNPEDHSTYGWFAENELDAITNNGKAADDAEFIAIKKGFSVLNGQPLSA
jgi:ADP-ribose pyrophosphatase YjhB (NUDIX family)